MKTTNAASTTAARSRADSEPGPFGGAPTRVADANALKSLIEASAANADSDNRETRELDPEQFRALMKQVTAPAPSEPEPSPPATFDDGVDAAFADPDAGLADAPPKVVETPPARPAAPPAKVVARPPARPVAPPAPSTSVQSLVLASVAVLAIAALVVVLVLAFS